MCAENQKSQELLRALVALVGCADELIPCENPSNQQLAQAETAIANAHAMITRFTAMSSKQEDHMRSFNLTDAQYEALTDKLGTVLDHVNYGAGVDLFIDDDECLLDPDEPANRLLCQIMTDLTDDPKYRGYITKRFGDVIPDDKSIPID